MPHPLPLRTARSRFETAWNAISRSRLQGFFKSLSLALALTVAPPALALDAAEMFDDPAKEARARAIGRELRCLVCQNESIFDSNAGLARDLRVLVRERMMAGDSDAEVIAFIHERYGDYVLLKPPVTAQTWPLWGAPVLFLALGGLTIFAYRRRQRRAETAPALTDEDRREAQRLLKGGDA